MAYPDQLRSLKRQHVLSLVLIGVGLASVAVMIIVESEPGGIPLLALLSGLAWHLITRARIRGHGRRAL